LQQAGAAAAGLYDVHLVIDHRFRAENRRALTISADDSESVVSSEISSAQSFVPAARFRPGSSSLPRTGSGPQLAALAPRGAE
jgi:hypothetical protein